MQNKWWVALIKGLMLLILGLIMFKFTDYQSNTFYMTLGATLTIMGLIGIAVSISSKNNHKAWMILFAEGLVDAFLGIAFVTLPYLGSYLLGPMLAIWAFLGGSVQIFNAVRLSRRGFKQWWIILVLGLTAMGFAGYLFTSFIQPGATFALILSVMFIMFGTLNILVSFSLKNKEPESNL